MKTMIKKLLLLLVFLPCSIFAQTMSGVVSDASGPLPGVNIVVQGTSNGAATDFDGNYTIDNLNDGDAVVFTYMGYKEFIVTYTGQATQNVTLEEDAEQIGEVVVIGYGSVKKQDATGSVTSVTSKDFNKGPVVSADQLLTGKAAGVTITDGGGSPDSGAQIKIRGGSSLSASNDPLIIIDGIPLSTEGAAGSGNPLALINPNDIESFSILKDASATAIYGSRASNGVILITTKRGTSGKPQYYFSSNVSMSQVTNPIDVMTGPEFENFIRTSRPDEVGNLGVPDGNGGRTIHNTDWQSKIYRTAISTNNDFGVRANLFEKLPVRASIAHSKTEGVVKRTDLERVTGSVKLTPSFFDDKLKVEVNAKGIMSEKSGVDSGGAIGAAVSMDPTKPAYDWNQEQEFGGYYQELDPNNNNAKIGQNPLNTLFMKDRPEKVNKFIGNIKLDYKIPFVENLVAVVNAGIESSSSDIMEIYKPGALDTYQLDNKVGTTDPKEYILNPGLNFRETQKQNNRTLDAYLSYSNDFEGLISRFSGQIGYSHQDFRMDGVKEKYRYNTDTGVRERDIDKDNPLGAYFKPQNLQSFFGRANVDLAEKYLFTATLRADASSFFSEDDRWGYFPAAGFAWKMHEEKFLENVDVLRSLKYRMGWGLTGQQAVGEISAFPYIPLFQTGSNTSYYFPGQTVYAAQPFEPALTWETTETYNLGFDFELVDNIISGSIDGYVRNTKDLLLKAATPSGQFLSNTKLKNFGELQNKGVELALNSDLYRTDDWTVSVNGNIAYNEGKVKSLGDADTRERDGFPTGGTGVKFSYDKVGLQPMQGYVYEQIYDANSNPIEGAFVDRNGDGVVDVNDKYYINMIAKFNYGFGFSVSYKKFDLTSSFRGQLGGKVYDGVQASRGNAEAAVQKNSNGLNNVLNQDYVINDILNDATQSDYFIHDATFLRMQNITLGYRFDKVLGKDLNLKLYVSGNNLFIWTKYEGQDPETQNGIDNNIYPRPRVYTFGLNLDF